MPSTEAMLMTLAGPFVARRRAQRFRQRLGQEEHRLDVEVHDLVPAAFGKFVELRAPGRAGIVDEDVELRLQLDDFGGELVAAFDRRNVDRQRDAFAVIGGRELLRGRLAGAGLARGDVDLRRALARKPAAIILPMPRDPPVTTATRPFSENRSLNMRSSIGFAGGFGRGQGASQGRAYPSSLRTRDP